MLVPMKRYVIIILLVCGVLYGAGYGFLRYKFPYGRSHRCSKVFVSVLEQYAVDHEGRYPQGTREGQLGLDEVLKDLSSKDFDRTFDLVLGKAGDLEEARQFYKQNGYLRVMHSSWHYVSGLTVQDSGRALAWDKIPLTHNGMRVPSNPREVIMVGGAVLSVKENEWEAFLKTQQALAAR